MSEPIDIPEDIREAAINLSDTITVERQVCPQSQKLQDWQTMMIERALLAERMKERRRCQAIADKLAEDGDFDATLTCNRISDLIATGQTAVEWDADFREYMAKLRGRSEEKTATE